MAVRGFRTLALLSLWNSRTPTPTHADATPRTPSHAASARSFVQTGDNVMIGGFIVQGTEPKRVIIRAIGPELTQYGVPNVLADPTLELHDGTGALIASNDNWRTTIIGGIITSDQVRDISRSGHAPRDGRESAIIAELPAGNYTAIVRGVNDTIGVALVEAYDLGPDGNSILGNISTRSFVQTDDNVMIGGFIVQGTQPKRVIVRGIGPELGAPPYNIPNALANPTLELHDGTGALIASNDNWRTTIIGGIITSDQVRDILRSGHAPRDGRESAIIAELPAGNYTAIVRGVNDTTGVALVEVYDLEKHLTRMKESTVSLSGPACPSLHEGGFFTLGILVALVLCAVACSILAGTVMGFFRSSAPSDLASRTLTFTERVSNQRAIEEVYWRHRVWPKERPDAKPTLDAVMSQAQLKKKVTDYERNSQALEDYWRRPITADQLQAEMDRMAQHTKHPEVLHELFEALGNDPFVIAECLARPVLAERLLTNSYAYDQRIHGELKRRAAADLQAHNSIEQMKHLSGKIQRD